jgi:hypothetical protein
VIDLHQRYPDAEQLFYETLYVKPATIGHVVNEFCHLPTDDSQDKVKRCQELLILFKAFLNKGATLDSSNMRKIRDVSAFSVTTAESGTVQRALSNQSWYIPDKSILTDAFRGKVELLDMPIKVVDSLRAVFIAMECKNKFLSEAVHQVIHTRGEVIRDHETENEFKIREKHIAL